MIGEEAMRKQFYVYEWFKNETNEIFYVGKGNGMRRFDMSKRNKYFMRIINKYPCSVRIYEFCDNEEDAWNIEAERIAELKAIGQASTNIHVGGCGGDTFSHKSEEEKEVFRKKISQITTGKNNPRFGAKLSEETRKKIAASKHRNKAIYASEKFRKTMSLVTSKENNGMYGRKHKEESKRKMSESKKGMYVGENNGMFGKKGAQALNGKPIYMFDENKNLIKEFTTMTLTLEYLNVKGHVSLYKAIKNKTIYKGFYWSREKVWENVTTIENTLLNGSE